MSGLDPVGRREVRDIIHGLKQQGRTVFFSTHILSDAEMLCDRVAVLGQGSLRGVGAPSEIVSIEIHAMEILFEVREGHTLPAALAASATRSGGRSRIEVPEAGLYDALDQLRGCGARESFGLSGAADARRLFPASGWPRTGASHAVEVNTR